MSTKLGFSDISSWLDWFFFNYVFNVTEAKLIAFSFFLFFFWHLTRWYMFWVTPFLMLSSIIWLRWSWPYFSTVKFLLVISKYLGGGFPGGSVVDLGSILWLGRCPGGGHGNPLLYSCLGNPMEQRSLAGYGWWGGKEVDTTEVTEWQPDSEIK